MAISDDTALELLVAEAHENRKYADDKVKLAWKGLITALSIPVLAGSVDFVHVEIFNPRFVMIGASLIGAAIMAYSFYLYLEIAHLIDYVKKIEADIQTRFETKILAWESEHTPWSEKQFGVPIIFSTFIMSMAVVTILAAINAASGFFIPTGAQGEPPLLSWWILGPCLFSSLMLFIAIFSFVGGILKMAGPPRRPRSIILPNGDTRE